MKTESTNVAFSDFLSPGMSAVGAKSDSNTISDSTMDISMEEKKDIVSQKSGTVLSGYTVITKSMIGSGMFIDDISCNRC